MKIRTFDLERYFAKYEFTARYLLSCSDCETFSLNRLLEWADDQTLEMWNNLSFAYTETEGHPMLREEISNIYDGLSADHALALAPEEGIFLFMQALLEPGDHVVCTFPAYQSLYEIARSIGCRVSEWRPDEAQGWRFDTDALKALIRPETRLIVANFPHNPTGSLPEKSAFDEMVNIARENDIYLFTDEMYRFLELQNESTLPSAPEVYDKAVSLFGMSKTFGLPGLRIGWLVSKDRELLDRVSGLKDYTTICNSAPSEILSIIALRARDEIIDIQLKRLRKNVALIEDFMRDFDELFAWNRPKGGSVCFPRLLLEKDTHEFCEKLVREAGIMLAPSRMFHYGDSHVRFGFGRENFPLVLEKFADYLKKQYR